MGQVRKNLSLPRFASTNSGSVRRRIEYLNQRATLTFDVHLAGGLNHDAPQFPGNLSVTLRHLGLPTLSLPLRAVSSVAMPDVPTPILHKADNHQKRSRPLTCRTPESHACDVTKMIQLRNVPDALHRNLKARAALAGMSLSDYLLAEIREIAEKPTLVELRDRLHKREPVSAELDTALLVREQREAP